MSPSVSDRAFSLPFITENQQQRNKPKPNVAGFILSRVNYSLDNMFQLKAPARDSFYISLQLSSHSIKEISSPLATPAGQVLITNGVFTLAELQALGGVAAPIATPPAGQVGFGWLRATDLKVAWKHTLRERFAVEPSAGIYNLFNFANFNLPPATMNGILGGEGTGSINGTTRADQESFRVGNGTGVYSLGAQRQIEFGLRVTF